MAEDSFVKYFLCRTTLSLFHLLYSFEYSYLMYYSNQNVVVYHEFYLHQKNFFSLTIFHRQCRTLRVVVSTQNLNFSFFLFFFYYSNSLSLLLSLSLFCCLSLSLLFSLSLSLSLSFSYRLSLSFCLPLISSLRSSFGCSFRT